MCGITGFMLHDGVARRSDVEAMNARLVHRGPDGAGVLVDGPAALAMRRLSIIDLEGGWQPIANEAGDIHVVQNGEIYNYRELRHRLEMLGHRFRTQSDTETLVHAYEQWDVEFPRELRGMFAFAIWDRRRRRLLLGRDRLGIKPLYYARTAQGILFASELPSLIAYPGFQVELNLTGLQRFLTFGAAGPDASFVRGVQQLPPGTTAEFKSDAMTVRQYWSLSYEPKVADATSEALCEQLTDAVRTHLVADVPVGAFLSGGIDSSAVVGLLAQVRGGDFQTFSIGFEEAAVNELEYAQAVAKRWGVQHHYEIIRPEATVILDQLLDHFGEPLAESSAVPLWYLSRFAAQHVKVVLSGDGGDEVFGGYTRYLRAKQHLWIDRLPAQFRRMGGALASLLPNRAMGKHFLTYAAVDLYRRYATEMQLFSRYWRRRILRPSAYRDISRLADPVIDYVQRMSNVAVSNPLEAMLAIDTSDYLPNRVLVKVDRTTMAHGLESRPPLLDHRLVEFAAAMPFTQKLSPCGVLKHGFKEAVRHIVDNDILNRPKAGFKVPFDTWFAGPLRTHFLDLVLSGGQCLELFAESAVREMFAENLIGRRAHGERLWAILQIEMWLRRLPTMRTEMHSATGSV